MSLITEERYTESLLAVRSHILQILEGGRLEMLAVELVGELALVSKVSWLMLGELEFDNS